MLPLDLKEFQEKVSTHLRPWQRSFQFWVRAVDIYTGYKVFQVRVNFEKDAEKREAMWEKQHEVAQIGKPACASCVGEKAHTAIRPHAAYNAIKVVLEKELGQGVDEVFDRFDINPLGSASIAQVHRELDSKIQHPGVQDLMMTDIRNLQAFALYMQKTDIKFDLYSVTKEMEKQIGYEFNFLREADAMENIRRFLRVLVMEYIDGIPILKLGDEMAKRGINPGGKLAAAAKAGPALLSSLWLNILKSLTLAYGQMILRSGFFHADPHPGNILICRGSDVALLDYGQVKDLPEQLRLGYASLVLAIADNDPIKASESYRELGIDTLSKCEDEQKEMLRLAQTMFDTKLPPGVTMLQPFSEESSIKKIAVQAFPEELFSVLRTVHLLRGLSVGLGINYSCAEQWRPIAEEALYLAGRLKEIPNFAALCQESG
ncbi:protein ACTIVITY OF BC1 COMPLEX kinase, chloroplastic [Sesamum angolense]|uniref:Protein ACTIVITY OF BC1 COMPLEX kinase, chloroplastic n=1 Tax=Sesamum angolense TaxID=2727404 RepID=A0AAE1WM22_9LAMI|nr:protein ACTIVITY OF BC1 COMPLEX kinase, chloroplastic [Sesamum angolense]